MADLNMYMRNAIRIALCQRRREERMKYRKTCPNLADSVRVAEAVREERCSGDYSLVCLAAGAFVLPIRLATIHSRVPEAYHYMIVRGSAWHGGTVVYPGSRTCHIDDQSSVPSHEVGWWLLYTVLRCKDVYLIEFVRTNKARIVSEALRTTTIEDQLSAATT